MDTLEVQRIIGFSGDVPNGLQVHPDRKNLIYPLGCNIIIEDLSSGNQTVLSKHTNNVSCIAIDPTGRFLASGQVTHMGFKAPIILWDYETKQPVMKKELHKVKVEALAFSCDSKYLISLGGRDCGAVVVWDVAKSEALCGAPAQVKSAGVTTCLVASRCDRNTFVTAGDKTLRTWKIDAENRKIIPTDVNVGGSFQRQFTCIEMADAVSPMFLAGTATGDILGITMTEKPQQQFVVPTQKEKLFSLGVRVISILKNTPSCIEMLVGAGDGTIGCYELKLGKDKRNYVQAVLKHNPAVKPWFDSKLKIKSPVTSIAKRGGGHMFFVGTKNAQIYRFNYSELKADLIKTCHPHPVNDIIFPFGLSWLMVTCSYEDVRVWNTDTAQELCRCTIPNMTCNAICITRDGLYIFSAWDDGKIRPIGFGKDKQTGCFTLVQKKDTVRDAHNKGVTAIAVTSCGTKLVSGGGEGQVRVWDIVKDMLTGKTRGDLVANMKEHKGKVTAIQIHTNDRCCVSASTDGSTIIWDLITNTRSQIVLANTLFKCVCFGGKDLHILTSGTDHKIGYWEVGDGGLLRELEGSQTGAINTIDIDRDGQTILTGGEDSLLKLWRYNEGEVTHTGIGHSNQITKARICPNRHYIVSGGEDGALHIWKFPDGC